MTEGAGSKASTEARAQSICTSDASYASARTFQQITFSAEATSALLNFFTMLFFILFIQLINPSAPFEGILIYQTDYTNHTNITKYYITKDKIRTDFVVLETDSSTHSVQIYDLTDNCAFCFIEKTDNTSPQKVYLEVKEKIVDFEIIDSTSKNRVIDMYSDQSLIGFNGNELYERRIEDKDLLIALPDGWIFNGMPMSHHSNYIASQVIHTRVLKTDLLVKETVVIQKLIAKIPMKLSEHYFKID